MQDTILKSLLFVPGDSEKKMGRGQTSGASALILDLEDSVSPDRTDIARAMVREFLQAHPETCIAVWIAIDDVDGDNGGLKVVPGSHRYELQCTDEADQSESFTKDAIILADGMVAEQTEMNAGDVLFFHGSMVHGSGPNRTADRFRRSLIFHYVPQTSVEIAKFYNPLLTPGGDEIIVSESTDGGACGEGWSPASPH